MNKKRDMLLTSIVNKINIDEAKALRSEAIRIAIIMFSLGVVSTTLFFIFFQQYA